MASPSMFRQNGLLEPPASGVTTFTVGRGELRAWSISSGVVILRATGALEKEVAVQFAAQFDKLFPGPLKAIFIDATDLEGYDPGFRIAMTDWAKGLIKRTDIHVCVQSKLVQMGVAVANMALGGRIRTHGSRAELQQALLLTGKPG